MKISAPNYLYALYLKLLAQLTYQLRKTQAVFMNMYQYSRLPLIVLLGYLAATCGAAIIGSYFTVQVSITRFYAALIKPVWAPAGWIFAPVWTGLYICMFLAIWQVWRKKPMHRSRAYAQAHVCWWVQLALNAAWPIIFWWQPAGFASFLGCAVLALAVLCCVAVMWRISVAAAALMVPYACWVSFATALSWQLWRLNSAS